ncbi:tonB-system energizer ExbB [Sphingomonas sp. Leaf21]|jgi:biopolymer transport protein ExbB|uniref:tonB-system energizer ExbB n=1 Tax=Sphingomonas sp. Leaf21 TaxID=2876550 RepID=UPI001E43D5BC|nr:tonB-system energizer ExbB [Sphingomonas sp. Leaf21]
MTMRTCHRYKPISRRLAMIATTAAFLVCAPSPALAQGIDHTDFDPASMFWAAVPVVKAVMMLLLMASIATWAVFVAKMREISRGSRAVGDATETVRIARTLASIDVADAPSDAMVEAAREELGKSEALILQGRTAGACERVADRISRVESNAVAKMRNGVPFLASVSSVGPFVGLFGTVWGIMHSFVGIAKSQSTSLSVVAPGIAEALLATALGLVAAIPATIMYNLLNRRLAEYRHRLADMATMVNSLTGREVESRHISR